ncbi:MAG TPA: hypothetical protein PLU80_19780, partial [Acidobacteriota bacterium]|nr:hypothetical protein [Acidobacteriota bacterium]
LCPAVDGHSWVRPTTWGALLGSSEHQASFRNQGSGFQIPRILWNDKLYIESKRLIQAFGFI